MYIIIVARKNFESLICIIWLACLFIYLLTKSLLVYISKGALEQFTVAGSIQQAEREAELASLKKVWSFGIHDFNSYF